MDNQGQRAARSQTPPYPVLAHYLGKWFLQLCGWQLRGEVPDSPRMVIIAAPHTSNWDFVYALASAAAMRLRLNWMGKHTLFRFPFGGIMRALGGIPVDRRQPGNLVEQIVASIHQTPRAAVLVPPSGTRRNTKYWKSGFYHIARLADVPLLCSSMDYARKTITLGCSFVPTGKVGADMDRIRDYYAGVRGKYPKFESPIRLKEETETPDP